MKQLEKPKIPKTVQEAEQEKIEKLLRRRKIIYELLGEEITCTFEKDKYIKHKGSIEIEYEGEKMVFKTSNLGWRLDQILRDLERGKSTDKRLNRIAQTGRFKDLNLRELNVKVKRDSM